MNFSINTKLVLLSTLLVWIFAPISIYACTCSGFPGNFCDSVSPNETIVLAVITGTPDSHLREARLIENIHNELGKENFTILGQDGLNCGEVLVYFGSSSRKSNHNEKGNKTIRHFQIA